MKTRNIWEVEDIDAGRYICRESWPEDSDDIGGLCSVTYKLGYLSRYGGSRASICKIAITDGLVVDFHESKLDEGNAKQLMVKHLNNDVEGFRLLTDEQVMRRMKHLLTYLRRV